MHDHNHYTEDKKELYSIINNLILSNMADKAALLAAVELEKQQFQAVVDAKNAQITTLQQQIADLQSQLSNSITSADGDEVATAIAGIVPE